MTTKKGEITQNRISQLASDIAERLRESIKDIQSVNDDIHVLSINAKILAAKAGVGGRGFAVVADAVRAMVSRTQRITDALRVSIDSTVRELMEINDFLGTKVRAERLSQVAENMIDIVDRNLYERSCDVRWWSTEASLVAALENPGPETLARCGERLGIILDSYTVYLDIVVCDLSGNVVASRASEMLSPETGRPLRALLVDGDGRIIAESGTSSTAAEALEADAFDSVRRAPRGFLLPDNGASRGRIIGFAASRGFETYRSGWHAMIQEEILED